MYALSAAELLDLWERGQGAAPVQRAVLLLAATQPEASVQTLARLPLGQRDARLLRLRAGTFGDAFACVVECPACAERLEFTFQVDDILIPAAEETPESLDVAHEGYTVSFRLPTSEDVARAAQAADAFAALLQGCVVAVRQDGATVSPEALPAAVVEAVAARMAETDPQADTRLAMTCPACRHTWGAPFDIATYFWKELESWALRLLGEVHALARAYGWAEADILAMSAWRRQGYLNLVRH